MTFALGEGQISLFHKFTIHIIPAAKSSAPSADTIARASDLFSLVPIVLEVVAVGCCPVQGLQSISAPTNTRRRLGSLFPLAVHLLSEVWIATVDITCFVSMKAASSVTCGH